MVERWKPNKDIRHFIVEPIGKLESDYKENLLTSCRRLMKNVWFFHEPKGGLLDLLVENCQVQDNAWVEITPKNNSKIIQLSFNGDSHDSWNGVEEGLVDVRYVKDVDCMEFRIGPTNYRVFARPGPKAMPVINSEKPTFYQITYEVKGNSYTHKGVSPVEQIKGLDGALLLLEKYADLYYLIHGSQGTNSCPYVSLSHEGFSGMDGEIMYVDLEFLQPGHLEHIMFKQQVASNHRGAIILGIHGGGQASFCIGKTQYDLRMKSKSYQVLSNRQNEESTD